MTIRTAFAFASKKIWPVYQMDVKSTFLNDDLTEEVYVEQPPTAFQKVWSKN